MLVSLNTCLYILWAISLLCQIHTCYFACIQGNLFIPGAYIYFFVFHNVIMGDISDDIRTTPCSFIEYFFKGLISPFTDRFASIKIKARHLRLGVRIEPLEAYSIGIALRWLLFAVFFQNKYYYPYQVNLFIDILLSFALLYLNTTHVEIKANLVVSCWYMLDIFNIYLIFMGLNWCLIFILGQYIIVMSISFILLNCDMGDKIYDIIIYSLLRHGSVLSVIYEDHLQPNLIKDELYLSALYKTILAGDNTLTIQDIIQAHKLEGYFTHKGNLIVDLAETITPICGYNSYIVALFLGSSHMLVWIYFHNLASLLLPTLALVFYNIFIIVGAIGLLLCKSYLDFRQATRGLRILY